MSFNLSLLKSELSKKSTKIDFKEINSILRNHKSNVEELINILIQQMIDYNVSSNNSSNTSNTSNTNIFNKHGYYKYLFYENEFLEGYIIYWRPYSKTTMDIHNNKKCYMTGILGEWREQIYKNRNILSNILLIPPFTHFIDQDIDEYILQNTKNELSISLHIFIK